jgi:ATP-dependent Clp protease adaptor protein ClpS
MVGIAQLAERLVVVQEVAGSSPVTHPNTNVMSAPQPNCRGSALRRLRVAAVLRGHSVASGRMESVTSPAAHAPVLDTVLDTAFDTALDEKLDQQLDERVLHAAEVPWLTVIWNDPVNLQSYVAWVFRRHFGLDESAAHDLMMQVHTAGRATLAHGNREHMERHTEAMHEYGLWATVEKAPR